MRIIDRKIRSFMDPNGELFVIAHRADIARGENSLTAVKSAIAKDVDMIEIDIRKTLDGKYILCHDRTVNRTTERKGRVNKFTADEITQFVLKNSSDTVPLFTDMLDLTRDKIMLNLDKEAFANREEIYEILEQYSCLEGAVFKSRAAASEIKKWFDTLKLSGKKPPLYSPIIKTHSLKKALELIASFQGIAQMAEILYKGSEKNMRILCSSCKSMGMRPMRLTLSKKKDVPVFWEKCVRQGFNTLMTDKLALSSHFEIS